MANIFKFDMKVTTLKNSNWYSLTKILREKEEEYGQAVLFATDGSIEDHSTGDNNEMDLYGYESYVRNGTILLLVKTGERLTVSNAEKETGLYPANGEIEVFYFDFEDLEVFCCGEVSQKTFNQVLGELYAIPHLSYCS